jgi:hypothetical protein
MYGLALRDSRFEIALVVGNGQPKMFHHLLQKSIGQALRSRWIQTILLAAA